MSFCFLFNVIMLAETWYADESDIFELPMYKSYFLNRSTGRGGGVSLMVRENASGQVLEELSRVNEDFEVLSLLVDRNIVSVFYRPPGGCTTQFFFLF
uniref:Putative tick transposon n=1 Tax=Ixodes ricinus TaxID=34613 RepID=A0A6B0UAN4_IXORI